MGDAGENSTQLILTLYTDEEYGFPNVTYTFYIPRISYEDLETTDLSGSYYVADGEETFPQGAGTVDIGSAISFGDFTFPDGSFVVTGMMEYFIPDGMVSLILARNEEGKYNVTGAMANADFSGFYMFMDEERYIPIEYYDGTEED